MSETHQGALRSGSITADEPIADVFSAEKAARYLDTAALHWQKTRNCAACHVNMGYLFARPALSSVLEDSGEVRGLFEEHATGFAIVVGRELGVSSDDPRLRRGIDWLLSNQKVSGKWFCRSPAKDSRHYSSNFGTTFDNLEPLQTTT